MRIWIYHKIPKKDMYETIFRFNDIFIKNNLKSSMVKELLSNLDIFIDKNKNLSIEPVVLEKQKTFGLYCTNLDCEWLKYVRYFYTQEKASMLYCDNDVEPICIICKRIKNGSLKWKDIKVKRRDNLLHPTIN